MDKVTIVGLGLIGGSIGLALKAAKLENVQIVGHDKEPSASAKASKRGAVDKTEWNLINAVEGASVVIIATPVMAIKEVMQQVASYLREGAVVTDTGSTKASILQWSSEILPSHVSFVGGHPMAGKETPGIDGAEATLFKDKTYCIIPGKNATEQAVRSVVSMAELLGANPFFIDAAEHDSYVAAVSHLPIVLSAALATATSRSPSWKEMSRLAASGYKDLTRLAMGDPEMNRDICLTNPDSIVRWIDNLVDELAVYRKQVLEGKQDTLKETFDKAYEARDRWLQGKIDDKPSLMAQIPGAGERMAGLLISDRLAQRSRQMLERADGQGKGKQPKG